MSVIRLYGATILNLTKVFSITKYDYQKIKFVFPLSNYYQGGSTWASDSQTYEIKFNSEHERDAEHTDIAETLKRYYQK